jgi:hypothetical protein
VLIVARVEGMTLALSVVEEISDPVEELFGAVEELFGAVKEVDDATVLLFSVPVIV